jgi:hypothetical protein
MIITSKMIILRISSSILKYFDLLAIYYMNILNGIKSLLFEICLEELSILLD